MIIYSPVISGSITISGSLVVQGASTLTASLATSASYALTASYALNGGGTSVDTGSFVTTSSFNTYTSSINNATGSFVLNSQTSSFTTNSSFNSFTSSINNATGSFATTGSNTFKASQIISGSLTITQNLTVLGSSSITYVTSSQLNIGTNIITVNANNPLVRYGGLAVIDSGSSPQTSGSILFDSTNNQWIFVHQNTAGAVTSSVFIQGPQTFNNVGNETVLTTNRVPKATGGDLGEHIGDSNITDTGTVIQLGSATQVTGSLNVSAGITGSALAIATTTPLSTTKAHIKGIVGIENGSTAGTLADQLLFGYNGSGLSQYNHKIQTSHDSQAVLNKMDFLVSNGASTFLNTLTLRSSGLSRFDSGQGLGVSGSLQVTGSLNVSAGITGSLLGTASRVLSSNGSAFTIQYGGGASGILMTGSSNLQYNGTNITLNNGKIAQSDGTVYYTYLGSYQTGTENGIWASDTALENDYPIVSYDISTNKYSFAGYNVTYNNANGNFGIGTTTPAEKLHVVGNITVTGSLNVSGSVTLPRYNSTTAFPGTNAPVAKLAVDSNGNVVTVANGYAEKLDLYSGLGSNTKVESPFYSSITVNSTSSPTNFQFHIQAMPIAQRTTVTGVKWYQGTNGVYTSTSGTSVALYTYSAGTITLVASSSNQAIFSSSYGAASTWRSASFTSTYNANPGTYYVGFCWNPSGTTTGPSLGISTQIATAVGSTYDYTNSAAIAMLKNGQGNCPPSQALNGMTTAFQTLYYLALY